MNGWWVGQKKTDRPIPPIDVIEVQPAIETIFQRQYSEILD